MTHSIHPSRRRGAMLLRACVPRNLERSEPKADGGPRSQRVGFTLIELLVVMAIIAILAAMIFPITRAVNRAKIRARANGELAQLQTAIESYKAKLGVYPPDNAGSATHPADPYYCALNPLYYELEGTAVSATAGKTLIYKTLDGSAQISSDAVMGYFGVSGFMNCSRGAGGDEGQTARNFFPGISQQNIGEIRDPRNGTLLRTLICSVPWPNAKTGPLNRLGAGALSPWQYNMSHPTNNPTSYDLWVDLVIDGKTNRICNWSSQPLVVP